MSDVLDAWATHLYAEGKTKRTVQDRMTTMRRFERDSGLSVLDASTTDLAQWLARPALGNLAKSVYHSMFRAFFRWAIGARLRLDDPMVTIKAAKRPPTRPRPITLPQYRRLIATDDRDLKAMVLLAGLQGLRVHEIARFHTRQLDVEARTLTVTGKGGSTYTLPAHDLVIAHAARMPRSGYWFPSQRAAHIGGRCVSERVRLHMLRNNINAVPHQLRHFYGTQLVGGGADLRVVQELMRHSSLQTTAIYTLVSDARRRDAIDRLNPLEDER